MKFKLFDVRSTSRMYKKWKNHSLCMHSAHSGWRSAYFLNTIVSSHSALNKREARDKNKKYMHNSHLSLSVLLKRLKSTFFLKEILTFSRVRSRFGSSVAWRRAFSSFYISTNNRLSVEDRMRCESWTWQIGHRLQNCILR